jgi:hypothetical protein
MAVFQSVCELWIEMSKFEMCVSGITKSQNRKTGGSFKENLMDEGVCAVK